MSERFRPSGTWRKKLEKQMEPKIVDVAPKQGRPWGPGRMLIATPLLVNGLMRQVQEGKLVTVGQIRERLARDFNVDFTCPLTTGIFVRIAAEAAEEDLDVAKKEITPYWRVVREDGGLNEKFPGGVQAQSKRLEEEGHTIEPGRGRKPPRVKDFERHLASL